MAESPRPTTGQAAAGEAGDLHLEVGRVLIRAEPAPHGLVGDDLRPDRRERGVAAGMVEVPVGVDQGDRPGAQLADDRRKLAPPRGHEGVDHEGCPSGPASTVTFPPGPVISESPAPRLATSIGIESIIGPNLRAISGSEISSPGAWARVASQGPANTEVAASPAIAFNASRRFMDVVRLRGKSGPDPRPAGRPPGF